MIWVTLLFGSLLHVGASDLCAERLWRQLRALPTAGPLTEEASALFDWLRHDALLMEISFLKPGSVNPDQISQTTFAPLVTAHAELRLQLERLRAHNFTLADPRLGERVRGRASFRDAMDVVLKTVAAWRLVRAFWAEWFTRLPEGASFGTMQTRIFDVEREIQNRARRLIGQARLTERRDPGFGELLKFIAADGQKTRAEVLEYLWPYLKIESELFAAEQEARRHREDVLARRQSWRVIDGDRD